MTKTGEEMRVFISWSGERSKTVALALRGWLKKVTQGARFFVSERDIPGGVLWDEQISAELAESNFGICVLTPESLPSQWMIFEAGALAKTVSVARVVPYLIGLKPGDVRDPLGRFQAVQADRDGTLNLVRSINTTSGRSLDDELVVSLFESNWAKLESIIVKLPKAPAIPVDSNRDEVLGEILNTVRSVQRTVQLSERMSRTIEDDLRQLGRRQRMAERKRILSAERAKEWLASRGYDEGVANAVVQDDSKQDEEPEATG